MVLKKSRIWNVKMKARTCPNNSNIYIYIWSILILLPNSPDFFMTIAPVQIQGNKNILVCYL